MNEQASFLDDEPASWPVEAPADISQRPNAVIRNGGPQLLRGLMLPLCPSANRYWTQMMMPKKGSKYPMVLTSMKHMFSMIRSIQFPSSDAKDYVKWMTEYALQKGFRFHSEKPLRMDVVVCPRNRAAIDAHNYSKVLLDAFEQVGVYVDDAQVEDLRVRMGPVIKGGRLVVSLWEISPNHDEVLKDAWG